MKTRLQIDPDVLSVAQKIATRDKTSAGKVLSDLARRSLHLSSGSECRNGVPVLPGREKAPTVTLEIVNHLRDLE